MSYIPTDSIPLDGNGKKNSDMWQHGGEKEGTAQVMIGKVYAEGRWITSPLPDPCVGRRICRTRETCRRMYGTALLAPLHIQFHMREGTHAHVSRPPALSPALSSALFLFLSFFTFGCLGTGHVVLPRVHNDDQS
jgi:hypothetical protein